MKILVFIIAICSVDMAIAVNQCEKFQLRKMGEIEQELDEGTPRLVASHYDKVIFEFEGEVRIPMALYDKDNRVYELNLKEKKLNLLYQSKPFKPLFNSRTDDYDQAKIGYILSLQGIEGFAVRENIMGTRRHLLYFMDSQGKKFAEYEFDEEAKFGPFTFENGMTYVASAKKGYIFDKKGQLVKSYDLPETVAYQTHKVSMGNPRVLLFVDTEGNLNSLDIYNGKVAEVLNGSFTKVWDTRLDEKVRFAEIDLYLGGTVTLKLRRQQLMFRVNVKHNGHYYFERENEITNLTGLSIDAVWNDSAYNIRTLLNANKFLLFGQNLSNLIRLKPVFNDFSKNNRYFNCVTPLTEKIVYCSSAQFVNGSSWYDYNLTAATFDDYKHDIELKRIPIIGPDGEERKAYQLNIETPSFLANHRGWSVAKVGKYNNIPRMLSWNSNTINLIKTNLSKDKGLNDITENVVKNLQIEDQLTIPGLERRGVKAEYLDLKQGRIAVFQKNKVQIFETVCAEK